MTSDQAFNAIEKIAATSKKNEKEAMVKQFLAFDTFKRALVAALDPLVTYGMQQVPDRIEGAAPGANTFENAPIWETLDKLAARTLTGNDARNEVQRLMTFLTPQSAELFKRIIRKDLRAGFSGSTVNKAWKGLIQEFPYMRCVLPEKAKFEKWDWAAGVFSQHKADGAFTNVDHEESGVVRLTTRQGNELPIEAFPAMADEIRRSLTKGTQTHGEIVVFVDGVMATREIGNGILNRIQAGGAFAANEVPVFYGWDQIPLSAVVPKGEHQVGYRERFKGLLLQLVKAGTTSVKVIPTKIVHSLKEAYEHCTSLQIDGKEGTVIKEGSGIWKDTDSGNPFVVKLKLEVDVDLVCVGVVPGRVGTKNEGRAGSITLETSDGLLRVDAAVKGEKMRDDVDANPTNWIGSIVALRFNSILKPSASNDLHSLFLPRLVEASYRTDKIVADSLEEVFAQFNAKVTGVPIEKKVAEAA
jgi:DNA ligase-1